MPNLIEILLKILIDQLLPVFAVILVGWLLAYFFHPDIRVIAQIAQNAFLPCLIFNTLVTTQFDLSTSGKMVLFTLLCILVSGVIAYIFARILRLERVFTSSFMLVIMFSNVGNFGLPVILYAFGEEALAQGMVYMVIMNILLYTLGVAILTNGQAGSRESMRQALLTPLIYSPVLALFVIGLNLTIPPVVMRPIELMGSGAIPLTLILLGMQLQKTPVFNTRLTWVAVALRLVIVPLIVFPLTRLMSLNAISTQAAVIQTATPAGISTTVLAMQYQAKTEFVNTVVFLTTVLSAFTITPMIFLLSLS